MTLDELLSHHKPCIRQMAYELLRVVDIHQIEEVQRGVPMFMEPMPLKRDIFRPLSN